MPAMLGSRLRSGRGSSERYLTRFRGVERWVASFVRAWYDFGGLVAVHFGGYV